MGRSAPLRPGGSWLPGGVLIPATGSGEGRAPSSDPEPSGAPGPASADEPVHVDVAEPARTRRLGPVLASAVGVLTATGIVLAVNQIFNLQALGFVLVEGLYLYILAGLFLAVAFLIFPLRPEAGQPGAGSDRAVLALDVALAVLSLGVAGYFAATAETSLEQGWEYAAPDTARYAAVVFWALIIEATRRTGGLLIAVIVLVFSLYPTFADQVPGPISGFAQPFWDAIPFHLISAESAFGIPMRAFGSLVIGFILFGAVLQRTGGGTFFNNLALGLVGAYRGGAAKVAIFASGFMGSMSGSVISNVLTTGAVSIPAMKRTGFSGRYAAATEACASTGGVLMPPIMGATAFLIAQFLGMPYTQVAFAAAIPSILYYFGLFVQVDAYAARRGLRGLEPEEVPSLRDNMREGWQYLVVFAVLIYLMVGLRIETQAPFYATALLLLINQVVPRTRLSLSGLRDLLIAVGQTLGELVAILLGVGLIVGAFAATGLAGTLVNDLVFLAGGSTFMLLVMGALTAFIFGMGMTVTACYVFLAVVLAPALTQAGLEPIAVHLFILYFGMVSYITPPVALGAFAAASMARTTPIRTGFEAMRLGGAIYIIPFFFVLNPALVGVGTWGEIGVVLLTALAGIWFIGSGLQGYFAGIGALPSGTSGLVVRALMIFGGLLCAAPGGSWVGLDHLSLSLIGAALAAPAAVLAWRASDVPATSGNATHR